MKMKNRNDLATAQMLFARKQYGQVISLLVPQIVLYRKEVAFHEILGLACLHTGDFGGAYSYLKRARDIDPQRTATLLGLAIVMLRRRKITDALGIWLEVLDIDPHNRQAKRALNIARTLDDDDWLRIIDEGKYNSLLLRNNSRVILRAVPVVLALTVGLGAIVIAVILSSQRLPYRANAELLEFDQSDYTQGDYSQFATIIFTERELEKKLDEIQRYFHNFRDNMVRYHGNQILMSNAPMTVKDRISLIITQLGIPDFTNFQDSFGYEQVLAAPQLYHGVYVRWKGRVANLVITEELISLDLLVGFDTGRIVQGTVPVILDFAVNLQGGESVEVIARVSGSDGVVGLSASSIRLILDDGNG